MNGNFGAMSSSSAFVPYAAEADQEISVEELEVCHQARKLGATLRVPVLIIMARSLIVLGGKVQCRESSHHSRERRHLSSELRSCGHAVLLCLGTDQEQVQRGQGPGNSPSQRYTTHYASS